MSDQTDAPTCRVGIAGVPSYAGMELARLVAGHDGFRLVTASSDGWTGRRLSEMDPNLGADGTASVVGYGDTVTAARDAGVHLMFLATSAERCADLAERLLEAGIRVVDLSGAHRLEDEDTHTRAYGFPPRDIGLHREALYGLTEWADEAALRSARIVSCPGRYPTAVLLALLPLVAKRLVDPSSLVIDAKCGTSGEGRRAQVPLLHSELFANFYARRIGCKQHTPEIVQELRKVGEFADPPAFVTHILPVARGLMATCYFRVPDATLESTEAADCGGAGAPGDVVGATERVRQELASRYAETPFVRVIDRPEDIHLPHVVGTNRCLLGATADTNSGRVVLVAALDNLLKGASGQALQNANVMCGFDATRGLRLTPSGQA